MVRAIASLPPPAAVGTTIVMVLSGYAMAYDQAIIPPSTRLHCVELVPGRGAQIARGAGTSLELVAVEENQATLKTSLGTLTRVLDAVHWPTISKGDPDAWLYFYENFLEVYDNDLRKMTGSYYTPPEVVGAMVRLVDEVRIGIDAAEHLDDAQAVEGAVRVPDGFEDFDGDLF